MFGEGRVIQTVRDASYASRTERVSPCRWRIAPSRIVLMASRVAATYADGLSVGHVRATFRINVDRALREIGEQLVHCPSPRRAIERPVSYQLAARKVRGDELSRR